VNRILARIGTTDMVHIFSVDLEEYFQVNAFEASVPRDDWSSPTGIPGSFVASLTWDMKLPHMAGGIAG